MRSMRTKQISLISSLLFETVCVHVNTLRTDDDKNSTVVRKSIWINFKSKSNKVAVHSLSAPPKNPKSCRKWFIAKWKNDPTHTLTNPRTTSNDWLTSGQMGLSFRFHRWLSACMYLKPGQMWKLSFKLLPLSMPSCEHSLDMDDRVNVDDRIARIEYNM